MTIHSEPLTGMELSDLLGQKVAADNRVQNALQKRQTYRTPLNKYDENGNQLYRTIAVVRKGSPTTNILGYIAELDKANQRLLDRAPNYFSKGDAIFRKTSVIENVRTIAINNTWAASVQTNTGEKLAKLIAKQIDKLTAAYDDETDAKEKESYRSRIIDGQIQYDNFMLKPEKKYKRRSKPTREVVVVYRCSDPSNPREMLPAQKHHVTAGGLVLIRDRRALDTDIKIVDTTSGGNRSIYDEVMPIETILDISGSIYDADELDLAKEARKQRRTDNINKPRSQFDGNIV